MINTACTGKGIHDMYPKTPHGIPAAGWSTVIFGLTTSQDSVIVEVTVVVRVIVFVASRVGTTKNKTLADRIVATTIADANARKFFLLTW